MWRRSCTPQADAPDLVVSTTVLVAEQGSFPRSNELYTKSFPDNPPARMTMQVPIPRPADLDRMYRRSL